MAGPPKWLAARSPKMPTVRWASRQAIVVTGAGSGSGTAKSHVNSPEPAWIGAVPVPRGRTFQQSATGSHRYSSSVSPSSRGRACSRQCQSSCSTSCPCQSTDAVVRVVHPSSLAPIVDGTRPQRGTSPITARPAATAPGAASRRRLAGNPTMATSGTSQRAMASTVAVPVERAQQVGRAGRRPLEHDAGDRRRGRRPARRRPGATGLRTRRHRPACSATTGNPS